MWLEPMKDDEIEDADVGEPVDFDDEEEWDSDLFEEILRNQGIEFNDGTFPPNYFDDDELADADGLD